MGFTYSLSCDRCHETVWAGHGIDDNGPEESAAEHTCHPINPESYHAF